VVDDGFETPTNLNELLLLRVSVVDVDADVDVDVDAQLIRQHGRFQARRGPDL
jgi:hypothetical protein